MNKAFLESRGWDHWVWMGSPNLRTLHDYARSGYGLRVECHCGRVTLDPHRLLMDALARRMHLTLAVFEATLRCLNCGWRPKQIGTQPR